VNIKSVDTPSIQYTQHGSDGTQASQGHLINKASFQSYVSSQRTHHTQRNVARHVIWYIYISRLCYDVSVRLSVTEVHLFIMNSYTEYTYRPSLYKYMQ